MDTNYHTIGADGSEPTTINLGKFKTFLAETHEKLGKYSEVITPKLLALLDEVPDWDQNTMANPYSGSYSYDWLLDKVSDIIYDALFDAGDEAIMSDGSLDDDSLGDAAFTVTDVLDIIYGNPKSLIEKALSILV
jgi:hypothetical protein